MPDLPTMREMIEAMPHSSGFIFGKDPEHVLVCHRCKLKSLYSQLAALVKQWESCAGHNALPLNESPLTLKLCAKQLGARLGPAKETPAGE
jgi:hypothetical protein